MTKLEEYLEGIINIFHQYSVRVGNFDTLSKGELKQLITKELATTIKVGRRSRGHWPGLRGDGGTRAGSAPGPAPEAVLPLWLGGPHSSLSVTRPVLSSPAGAVSGLSGDRRGGEGVGFPATEHLPPPGAGRGVGDSRAAPPRFSQSSAPSHLILQQPFWLLDQYSWASLR